MDVPGAGGPIQSIFGYYILPVALVCACMAGTLFRCRPDLPWNSVLKTSRSSWVKIYQKQLRCPRKVLTTLLLLPTPLLQNDIRGKILRGQLVIIPEYRQLCIANFIDVESLCVFRGICGDVTKLA